MTKRSLAQENALLKVRLAEVEAALADAQEAQRRLEAILGQMQREKFGKRSEKLSPEQFNLPMEDVELARNPASPDFSGRVPGAIPAMRRL